MTITRTPFFFGEYGRSLFGWLHMPAGGVRSDLAMVICPPLGHEYVNSHRSMRHLAEGLAETGIPSLRFEYDGTGDSAGSDEDPARLISWERSVHEAIRVCRDVSGCSRIGLLGVRFGATLAAHAAAGLEVACLVLWHPCIRGRAFLRELRTLHLTSSSQPTPAEEEVIAPGGLLMTSETQRDIGCIDLHSVVPRTKRALLVTRDDLRVDRRLCDNWVRQGIAAEHRAVPGFPEMFLAPHNAIVPQAAIEETVAWIKADSVAGLPPEGLPAAMRSEQRIVEGDPVVGICERIVGGDALFGILSEPEKTSGDHLPTILLSNAGATHHVGPNRLYVQLARRLARAGFRCLRFDLPGLGDSIGGPAAEENDPYVCDASNAIAQAAALIQRFAPSNRFVLMGLCSGAHTSFHAALDLDNVPIVESVLINPLTFYYRPGMPLDPAAVEPGKTWSKRPALQRPLRWVKLARRHARIAFYRLFRIHPVTAVPLHRSVSAENVDLEQDVRRIIEKGRRLTFVFSRFDPGYELLMINAAKVVREFQKKRLITLWLIDDASHTFEARPSRDIMIESIIDHLLDRYADARGELATHMSRILFIVAREHTELLGQLIRENRHANVEVIRDRRHGERRKRNEPAGAMERRRSDRRGHSSSHELELFGITMRIIH